MSFTKVSSPAEIARFSEIIPERDFGTHVQPLHDFLHGRVIGQERASRRLCRHITRYRAGLKRPDAPISVMVCVGPTGWGKTLFAKETSRALIADSPDVPFTLIDCSEYRERGSISGLIGTTAGYIGFGGKSLLSQMSIDGPHLWAKIRRDKETVKVLEEARKKDAKRERMPGDQNPSAYDQLLANLHKELGPFYSVIVFDEYEKAGVEVQQLLLGILGNGELRMGNGSVTRFHHALIVLTSNIAGEDLQRAMSGRTGKVGFAASQEAREMLSDSERMEKAMFKIAKDSLKKVLPPEMVGRFGQDIVAFRPLAKEQCRPALDKMLAEVGAALVTRTHPRRQQGHQPGCPTISEVVGPTASRERAARLFVTNAFETFVLNEGFSSEFGLRRLGQQVEWLVTDRLAVALESGDVVEGDNVLFDFRDGKVVMSRRPRPPGTAIVLVGHEGEAETKPSPPAEEKIDVNKLDAGWDDPPDAPATD
jgi:ATP-dependent Clp protease ATP-binding subunit ClpA